MGVVSTGFDWLRRTAWLGVMTMAAGCASIDMVKDPTRVPPKPGESVVMLSITGNTAQVSAVDQITVRRTNPVAGSQVELLHVMGQVSKGLARDTSLFIGVMPEGEYEVANFTVNQTGHTLPFNEAMRQRVGRFAVRGGQPVDLGRLIMTPVNASVVVGRSHLVAANLPMVRRFLPEQAKFFDGEVSSGWTGPGPGDTAVEKYALARPVGADNPVELASGEIAAASRLGTVLIRRHDGRWRAVRSRGLESLLDVMPGQGDETVLLASGEFGTLLRLRKGADTMEAIDTGDLPPGNLIFLDGNERTGWFVAHQKERVVTVFRSAQLDKGQWVAVRTESVGMDFWHGMASVWFWRRPGSFSYATSDGAIHTLDHASGGWSSVRVPQRLIGVGPNPDGSLGILTSPGGGFGGVFAGTALSEDGGRTWQDVKPEFKVKISPPRRLPSGTLLIPGGVFGNPELHASTDGGRTWSRRSDFRLDRKLVLLPSGAMLAVDMGQHGLFSISHSNDEGATWRVEYSNFDAQAHEASTRKK